MEAIWLYQFRLIVIGDSTVGKSCLIRRFTEGRFAQISDPTVGVDFFSRLVEIEPGKRIKLQIWDTAGQERFRSITRAYYRNSVGGLLLFDITNRRSFQNVHEWLEETKVHVQPYQIVFVLVGHKCDLDTQRQVTRHEAEKLAAAYGTWPAGERSLFTRQPIFSLMGFGHSPLLLPERNSRKRK
ncbi:ras-related protein Rab-39B isoform X3 [Phalacrocorax carbo]|uniref:ras-related protein Rab-39B isoform X3 n=1 Tax=Phalacrocorax carbo TaxID=9209 RepID=UPI00311A6DEE